MAAGSPAAKTGSAVGAATTGSAVADHELGLVRQAMAYRVKYRVAGGKRQMYLSLLGVQPLNRGGVYPSVAAPSEFLERPPPDAPKGEPRATRFAWSASKGTAAADVCGRASRDRSTATSPGRRCSSRSCGARTCRSLCRR